MDSYYFFNILRRLTLIKKDTIDHYLEKREFGKLEKEIALLEKKKSAIEISFSNDAIKPDDITEESRKFQSIIQDLETKEERWLELSMKLEE